MLMYDTTLTDLEYNQPAPCQHTHLVVETTGSLREYGGRLYDDVQERLVCTHCGIPIVLPEMHNAAELEPEF